MDTQSQVVSPGPRLLQAPLRQSSEPVGGGRLPTLRFSISPVRSPFSLLDDPKLHLGFGVPRPAFGVLQNPLLQSMRMAWVLSDKIISANGPIRSNSNYYKAWAE